MWEEDTNVSEQEAAMSNDKHRFYVDADGDDHGAYRDAMQFACGLAEIHLEIKRVILLIHHPQDTGLFEKMYGSDVVNRLFEGVNFKGCRPQVKFETLMTYQDNDINSDIVITCGLDSDEVSAIDNFNAVKAIVAIPFIRSRLEKWVKTWNPKQVRKN